MKFIIISNRITPHQVPLCEALFAYYKNEFCFIETAERGAKSDLGKKVNKSYNYVIDYNTFNLNKKLYLELILHAETVVFGSAPDCMIVDRIRKGGLTFRYAERFYKNGFQPHEYIRNAIAAWLHHGRYKKYPLYMLCASGYTAADCSKFGNYKGRCFKWGYFPEVKKYDDIEKLIMNKKKTSLIWAGRFLDWKRPDLALMVAEKLKRDGIVFKLKMFGNGLLEERIKSYIGEHSLDDVVTLAGAISPELLREEMEESSIVLCTSGFEEGWGAIVNEAMNSCCTVVVSHAVGAAPYLIKDGVNGLVYKNGNIDDLYNKVATLLSSDYNIRYSIGKNAYVTIEQKWNANIAARRLISLSESLRHNLNPETFADGPCSVAPIISNNWYIES
jgi:glycosyltransferase involved in cell wall biosynthesis